MNLFLETYEEPVIGFQRIRGFTTMRYINLRFTYLLTYFQVTFKWLGFNADLTTVALF